MSAADSIRVIEYNSARDVTNIDEFMRIRADILTHMNILRQMPVNAELAAELERVAILSVGFDLVHDSFLQTMYGALNSASVLTEHARGITRPGESTPPATTPFGTTVYVSDWNGLVSMFDSEDIEYEHVNKSVRDILLALTYSNSAFGSTLELRIDFQTGRFVCPYTNTDVFQDRTWYNLVDLARARRMKKRARTAGFALWTLLYIHDASIDPTGQLVLNPDVSDALRREHVPAARATTRNLAAPMRARPSKRSFE